MTESDLSATADFLQSLPRLPGEVETLVALDAKTEKIHPFSITDLSVENVTQQLQGAQGAFNCYFQVNAGPKNRKATKAAITHVRMLHVDIDDPNENVLAELRAFKPFPSVILMSGGGYQAFWFLDRLYKVNEADFESINLSIARLLKGDNCHNIDRIMRLPGTINVPNAKKRAKGRTPTLAYTVDSSLHKYPIEDFSHLNLATSARRVVVPSRVEDLPTGLPTDLVELIRFGDTKQVHKSRSHAVWHVVCACVRANLPRETIESLILHPDNTISAHVLDQPNPVEYAKKQVSRGMEVESEGWPDAPRGKPQPTYRNTMTAILRLGVNGYTDTFNNKKFIEDSGGNDGLYNDKAAIKVRDVIIAAFEFDPGKEHTRDALDSLCASNERHAVRDQFPQLLAGWDRVPRLQRMFPDYYKAEDTELNREIGEVLLVGMVRRILQPGVKFDLVVVLEGPQGSGKSTSLEILAGGHSVSHDVLAMDTRMQAETLQGVWLCELSELQGLRRADVEKIKSFVSRTEDKVRMAYAREAVELKRQCVLVGTTNEDSYLRDFTGNRRIIPIKTGRKVDTDALRRDRDQLIGEAIWLESQGRPINLRESLWAAAAVEQFKRLERGSWAEELHTIYATIVGDTARVSAQDVMAHLGKTADRQTRNDYQLAKEAMIGNGWTAKLMQINGKVVRGYEAPNDGTVQFECDRPRPRIAVDNDMTVNGKKIGEE